MKPVLIPLSVIIVSFLSIPNFSFADDLYKSKQANGATIYTSKKVSDDAEVAVLPQIMREKTVDRFEAFRDKTCATHGGVSCELGADGDGSVICNDGFKNSEIRFNFSCRTTRLSVIKAAVSEPENVHIVIRNEKSISATNIEVSIRTDVAGALPRLIKATGPVEIGGHQAGEYSVKYADLNRKIGEFPVEKVEITCENCN